MDSNTLSSPLWSQQVGDALWEEWVLGRDTLVYLTQPASPKSPNDPFSATLLIVVVDQTPNSLETELLSKILGALNLSMDAVFLHTGPVISWEPWIKNRLIAFGIQLPVTGSGGQRPDLWVSSVSLRHMLEDPDAKKTLWQQIKSWKDFSA